MDTLAATTPSHTGTVTSAPAAAQELALQELSFPALNIALDDYFASTDGPKPSRWERLSLIVGAVGAGLGMLLGSTFSGKVGAIGALTGLAIEVAGFGIGIWLNLKRDWPQFRHARSEHAKQIERSYEQYQQLVQQLRRFPLEQRRLRLRYIRDRRATMHERLGLFTGGTERLGVLPILIALYLQLKDWRWDDWNVFANITLVQGLLAFAILLTYALSWYLIHLRTRVQAYELLLAEANAQDAG
jgi:hypothetical protein